MNGIYPFRGEVKKRIEIESAQCQVERFKTITGLEMQVRHLEGRLSIAEAELLSLRRVNEALRDSICTRPLEPRRSWYMPESPECPYCKQSTRPFAQEDHDWVLGFVCISCDHDYHIKHRIEWPFDGRQEVYPSDLERLGFLVS